MEETKTRQDIFYEVNDDIATIYLNRSHKRNALTYEIWKAIRKIIENCEYNTDVKVIIFQSIDKKAFSAGADIKEFKTHRYTAKNASHYNDVTMNAERAIKNVSKPTIAMIQGFCVGGGCEIATACDLRFSDEKGQFGITPARLGLVYNTPSTKNVVDLVGPAKAKDILYTGRLLNADEAFKIGLIDRIFSNEEIKDKTEAYARKICANAQFAIRSSKHIINEVLEGATDNSNKTTQLIFDSFQSEDYQEGVDAFIEKRNANFRYS